MTKGRVVRGKGARRPPTGLTVEKLDVGDEEMVVFSWSAKATPPSTLSSAEADVLARIVRGQSNKEIARARKTSERTVANQVASLLRKTCANSRFELITRYAGALGANEDDE